MGREAVGQGSLKWMVSGSVCSRCACVGIECTTAEAVLRSGSRAPTSSFSSSKYQKVSIDPSVCLALTICMISSIDIFSA